MHRRSITAFQARRLRRSNHLNLRQLPEATTLGVKVPQLRVATFSGTANPNGDPTSVYFEYGTDSSYGNTTVAQNLGQGVKPTNFSIAASDLLPG